jgi:lipopolysaccharide/colanic/teichoic acid biosynthesis glycosyltransferase
MRARVREAVSVSLRYDHYRRKVIPSIYEFITLRAEAEMFEGLPVITLQGSPLYGWNVVVKAVTDFVGAAVALTLTAPLMLVIALAVKLRSPGPVFYRQERMGIDGKPFMMLKFRTMHVDQPGDTVCSRRMILGYDIGRFSARRVWLSCHLFNVIMER